MSKFVALDWDDQQVRAVFANVQGDTVAVDDAVVLPLETDSSNDLKKVAEVVRQSTADHRYRSAEAIVTIRRADVELRLLTLPEVPAEELPDIVRFQALRDFSEIAEDWPIDYLPISSSPGEMIVLAATVSTARVNGIQAVLNAADVKPQSLVLRPCAAASLVKHQTNVEHESVQLMVDEFGSSIELTVLRDQKATFIRTVQRPTGTNRVNHLAGEIRRTIVAAQNQLGGDRVKQVILFGSGQEHEADCEELQQKLDLTVTGIDPFHGLQLGKALQHGLPPESGKFAAALGLLVNQTDSSADVLDFLNPRKVEEPKSKRPLAIAGVASAAVVLLLLGGGFWWYLYSLDQQILKLQRESQGLRANVEAAQQRVNDYKSVTEWMRSDINWLDQMKGVSAALPPSKKAKVRDFKAYISPSGDGEIVLEGVVDSQSTIADIEQGLRDEGYLIEGRGGIEEKQDDKYPWRFQETATIETGNRRDQRTGRRGGTLSSGRNSSRAQQ